MLGRIFGVLSILALFTGAITGRLSEVGSAAVRGAEGAVTLVIALAGVMCLWSGIMRAADAAGLTARLSAALRPALRLIYPSLYKKARQGDAKSAKALGNVSASAAANMLGLGNAATPLGIQAMRSLKEAVPGREGEASREMIAFAVFSCASVQVIPTTLIALRAAAGSNAPFEVMPAVWICSLAGCAAAVVITKIFAAVFGHAK